MEAPAATINWGSPVLSTTVDSTGAALTSDYSIRLGVFANGFVPTETNVHLWSANWRTFSVASFDPNLGYFTATANLIAGGGSSDPVAYPGFDFSGLNAYIWITEDAAMTVGSESFLGRSESWVLPGAPPPDDCGCDGGLPYQWSTSDLAVSDVPVYGSQGPVVGGGDVENPGTYTIQTHVVPETSTFFLATCGLLFALRRRRMKS
ncbi:hypothetical protein OKA04_12510 [Luteolibacter flavescens]|uniref:PEP-CTERM protein-sorting domain-containing protein n=1 Tax=Luteolibacter flavescens TaxID=1859460 RepID=A0ABT3FPP5_9BACT|nr:hypothetical protein [Luteolibacter flavescens]MCW1885553.1 hypothetical protein [Luteolibacter flavescens]